MRILQNPLKHEVLEYPIVPITTIVVTHLPELAGYHRRRLPVVRLCLSSMLRHADLPMDLLVWDNGSNMVLRDELIQDYDAGLINTLVLSNNIGKTRALELAMRMTKSPIITYSDDDMFFYPKWLSQQVKILKHFTNVGIVTGYPCLILFGIATDTSKRLDKYTPDYTLRANLDFPLEWEEQYRRSVGITQETYDKEVGMRKADTLTYNNMTAYATGHHCQFTAYHEKIFPFIEDIPYTTGIGGKLLKQFDKAIDDAGLLRLATLDRTCRHIGNVIDQSIIDDMLKYDL